MERAMCDMATNLIQCVCVLIGFPFRLSFFYLFYERVTQLNFHFVKRVARALDY